MKPTSSQLKTESESLDTRDSAKFVTIMMSESGVHSQRILAIVVIFFSRYIVGIYSAARASSQLLLQQQQQQTVQLNQSRLDDTLDALDESLATGSELAVARNGTRNPRCKYELRMGSSASASKSCPNGIFPHEYECHPFVLSSFNVCMWVTFQLSPSAQVPCGTL